MSRIVVLIALTVWIGCSDLEARPAHSHLQDDVESQPARPDGVHFSSLSDSTRVVVDLVEVLRCRSIKLSNPPRIYVDLFTSEVSPGLMKKLVTVNDSRLKRILLTRSSVAALRVVLELNSEVEHTLSLSKNPPQLVVELRGARANALSTEPPRWVVSEPVVSAVSQSTQTGSMTAQIREAPDSGLELHSIPARQNNAAITEKGVTGTQNLSEVEPAHISGHSAPTPAKGAPETLRPAGASPVLQHMTLQIPRVTRPPKLEDFLKSLPREAETLITDFRQRSPGDGVSVSEQTSAYLSYDDKNLYVIFVCKEEAGKVRARMAKREDISDDDEVAVYLDTFHDRQRAYVFAANPLGIQRDGVISEGQGDDFKFDTLWHSEARLTDQGFTVWMAIPFKSLRFSNGPVQSWGIALRRFIPRNNESSFWPYITRRLQGLVQQMATLGGLEAASAGRNVQLIPYASFTSARLLDPQAPSFSTTNDWRAGFDAKAVIRNAFTLDATVNPDFSQVESDDPQVTVNRRFEVFFPEKRPFFIENAGFFQTPTNLFFSRRIADPEFGARLTGKVGRWAIGALAADDRAPGTQIQATDPLYGSRAGFGVARIQREFGDRSSFGMLATSRDFGPSSNRVISLDTRLKFSPNLFFTGQAAQSFDRQLDGKQVQGPAYFAGLDYSGKHLSYSSSYTDRSPDFRTLTGFVNRVDVRWIHNSAGYMWQPEGSRLLSFGPSVSGGTNWDRQGRLQDWYVNTDFRMDFTGPTRVTLSHYDAFELYLDKGYRQGSNGISLDTTLLKWLSVGGFHYQGTGINYSPPDGITPFLANSTNSSFRTTLRPTPRFRLDEIYYFSRLETRPGATPSGFSDSTDIFTNHLIRTRINYQFSRALSLRTILDYYAILPDSSLITQERFKRITGDILLTYLLNPGTALYVGYTDRFENLLLDPTIPSGVIPTLSPKTSTARQLFIKLSYLFQF